LLSFRSFWRQSRQKDKKAEFLGLAFPRTLLVNPISCPDLCGFAPLREALPGLYQQSPLWGGLRVREGTWFPHTPHSGGVCWFFDEVEKPTNPTAKLWHAAACVFSVRKQHTKQVIPVEGWRSPQGMRGLPPSNLFVRRSRTTSTLEKTYDLA